jgi:hypothetical protein
MIPGFFLDYFEPVEGIEFISDVSTFKEYSIDYTGCMINKDFPPIYDELKLKPELQAIIDEKRRILGPYIAVHVRRTDHIELAKQYNMYTEDESFFSFLDENLSDKNIYIATDNKETYELFKSRYHEKIKFEYHVTNESSYRKTSLADAIIDLFMCIHASSFMGSGRSSFSSLITLLRKDTLALHSHQ